MVRVVNPIFDDPELVALHNCVSENQWVSHGEKVPDLQFSEILAKLQDMLAAPSGMLLITDEGGWRHKVRQQGMDFVVQQLIPGYESSRREFAVFWEAVSDVEAYTLKWLVADSLLNYSEVTVVLPDQMTTVYHDWIVATADGPTGTPSYSTCYELFTDKSISLSYYPSND